MTAADASVSVFPPILSPQVTSSQASDSELLCVADAMLSLGTKVIAHNPAPQHISNPFKYMACQLQTIHDFVTLCWVLFTKNMNFALFWCLRFVNIYITVIADTLHILFLFSFILAFLFLRFNSYSTFPRTFAYAFHLRKQAQST